MERPSVAWEVPSACCAPDNKKIQAIFGGYGTVTPL